MNTLFKRLLKRASPVLLLACALAGCAYYGQPPYYSYPDTYGPPVYAGPPVYGGPPVYAGPPVSIGLGFNFYDRSYCCGHRGGYPYYGRRWHGYGHGGGAWHHGWHGGPRH
jgi:hypothetical protein